MGYAAAKRLLNTPATIGSQETRARGDILAKRRFRVAIRAAERVCIECEVLVRVVVNIKVNGMVPIRASEYSGSTAYLAVS